jgi:hypothetical protein
MSEKLINFLSIENETKMEIFFDLFDSLSENSKNRVTAISLYFNYSF